jgi:hypothetical protein
LQEGTMTIKPTMSQPRGECKGTALFGIASSTSSSRDCCSSRRQNGVFVCLYFALCKILSKLTFSFREKPQIFAALNTIDRHFIDPVRSKERNHKKSKGQSGKRCS